MTIHWLVVAPRDAVPEGDVIGVQVQGREIALYDVDGEVYATDNICTHGNARLCDGFVDGHEVECPLHQGKFDVRNGNPTCEPATEQLRTYAVRVEDGQVLIGLD